MNRNRAINFCLIFFILAFSCTLLAQDKEAADVEAALNAALQAYNAGEVEKFAAHFHSDVRGYFLDGSPMRKGMDAANVQGLFDQGYKPSLTAEATQISIHGDIALVTTTMTGSITWPGGKTDSGKWRHTEVRQKTDDGWKVIHYHLSAQAAAEQH